MSSCLLPAELLDTIFSFADTPSLFQLCRTCRYFRSIAMPRLVAGHIARTMIRLWIEQPGVAAHKPIDFVWHSSSTGRLVFSLKEQPSSMLLLFKPKASEAPRITGCTVVLRHHGNNMTIYSISYSANDDIVLVPVSSSSSTSPLLFCEYDGKRCNDDAYDCGWRMYYGLEEEEECKKKTCRLVPKRLECDVELLDPRLLHQAANNRLRLRKSSRTAIKI